MHKFIYILIYLLSRSPMLSLTLDKSFHNVSNKNFQYKELRISLFSMGIGCIKIYFITFKKEDGFKFIKVLKLSDIKKIPTKETIEEKVNIYKQHVSQKENDKIQIEIEFLKYKIENEETIKNNAANKISNYTAIMLVFIPLIISGGIKLANNLSTSFKLIFWTIIIYNLENIVMYILDFLKVKAFYRSAFSELKNCSKHLQKLAESYYEDWYSIKSEAPLFVTYVLEIERYLKYTLVYIMIFFCINTFSSIYSSKMCTNINVQQSSNSAIDITFNQKGFVNEEDLNKFIIIQNELLKNQLKQIIILKDFTNNEFIEKEYKNIINLIDMYNMHRIDIIEIDSKSKIQSKENTIKVLLIGG